MKYYKILIVDDEPENLEVIVNHAENSEEPYHILQALNARYAYTIAQKEKPELIITDWDMPEMDGIDLIKMLKKDPETHDIPVIMCTGVMTSSENLKTALEAGAVDYIRKPIDKIELIARMRSMLLLAESYKEIKELSQKKDQILSIIAHDLKAPVGNLNSLTEFILSNQLDMDEIRNFVKMIKPNIGATFTLLDNLLSWARNQKELTHTLPERFNLYKVVTSNIRVLENLADKKQISIENHVDEHAEAYADKNMISTVIRNLLSNAIKFSHQHTTVKITSSMQKEQLLIAVEDAGIGIDNTHIQQIFDGERLLSTKGTASEKGSGLGLSLSKDFVKKNGGEIYVRSEKDNGSVFYFTVPVAQNKQK